MYEKSTLGRKYTQLITGSPIFFIFFVFSGIALFLYLTMTTKIDVLETYRLEPTSTERGIEFLINGANITAGPAYIYTNKNEIVYPVVIKNTKHINGGYILYLDEEGQKIIQALSGKSTFIDIPRGTETLLYRIFVRGGRARE